MPASFPRLTPEPGACPACERHGLQAFYDVPDVPVNSCILMASREEALSYPRGHLRLAFCPGCGFVTSTRFDMEPRGIERMVRSSTHYFTTDEEIDLMASAVEELARI